MLGKEKKRLAGEGSAKGVVNGYADEKESDEN